MRKHATLAALLALAGLSACDAADDTDTTAVAGATKVDTGLDEALKNSPDVSGLAAAMERAGLAGIFSSPGGYTVIAPPNSAFEELTATGDGQDAVEPAILAAMMREYLLPGQLDLDAIGKAIDDNGGPITVATMGTGTIEFARDGEKIIATHSDGGTKAVLTGSSIQANNGALLLADGPLVAQPTGAAS
ncbi:fasciclin domain-containing protein [Parerythrobacter aurantius]|uniref:fasciclin domain-containing protein n=1 Tax=Parerythrobacter aurantius TaxID=3127706 RepID=UPI0032505DD9